MIVDEENSALADDPREWTVAAIAEELGFHTESDFTAALGSIEKSGYHQFVLPCGRKRRVISSPRPWLKQIQRRAYDAALKKLPISPSVYSRAGASVVKNAQRHIGHLYLTVLDISNCFPSTRTRMVERALLELGIPDSVSGMLTRLTTYKGFLPQGPPTSPAILNLVFRPIDDELTSLAKRYDAVYTRYVDDLAFSGNRPLFGIAREVARILRRHGYSMNPRKRRELGPSDAHIVTNIVVGETLNPTPEFLAGLPRDRRRSAGRQCSPTDRALRGRIAWVKGLNPALGRTLERRLLALHK